MQMHDITAHRIDIKIRFFQRPREREKLVLIRTLFHMLVVKRTNIAATSTLNFFAHLI